MFLPQNTECFIKIRCIFSWKNENMKRENEIAFFISLLRICNPQVLSSQLQSNKHLKYSLQIGFYLIGFKILILITNPA